MSYKELQNLKQHGAQTIRSGSKSFTAAGYILGRENRDLAFLLYSWCRYCDDSIDELPLGASPAEVLKDLKRNTLEIYEGQSEFSEPAFSALAYVCEKRNIPRHYPSELLEGMDMDIHHSGFESIEDLMLYCYRVAGVVGLMMAHVMGVSHEKALKHACDMGMAMQLTNIARDVVTDAKLGRVYIPKDMLSRVGIEADPQLMSNSKNWDQIYRSVLKLLDHAEEYYKRGDEGLKYLSFRSAFAIYSARTIYSSIGDLIRKRGPQCWEKRIYTSRRMKVWLILKSLVKVTRVKAPTLFQAWGRTSIRTVWRFQRERLLPN